MTKYAVTHPDKTIMANTYSKVKTERFNTWLKGKNLSDNTDPQGKHLFVEMAKVAQAKDEGQVDYMWPLPGIVGVLT